MKTKKAPAKNSRPKAKAKKATKPAKKAEPSKSGKLSAIDAAAKVLGESKEPLNTRAMIEAMSKRATGPALAARRLGRRSILQS